MTSEKIETLLEDVYGISDPMDCWIKLPQISIIYTHSDARIFTSSDEIYYFDSTDNSLNISRSHKYETLTELEEDFSSYPVQSKIDMNIIAGFISTSVLGPFGTVITRRF